MLQVRKLILALVILGLPLQGALAAIMPLCAQSKDAATASKETRSSSSASPDIPLAACAQHDSEIRKIPAKTDSAAPTLGFSFSCDEGICNISGNGLPPAASALNLARGFSYAISFNPRFTSFFLLQPQRPPLA